MSVGVLDYVGAFAGAVADEQAWALLQVFCEAGFVDDCRGGFGDLAVGRRSFAALRMTWREYCRVDFHAAGVDHRDDETVWGSFAALGMTKGLWMAARLRRAEGLGYEGVKRADCNEWLAGAEAKSFGC